ncbi:MAG: pyridoxal phosphate-dependent aminotransferase [Actinomycetota bacterium]|nr:pyridoxal phosphate-dependent aminotransferase [Actinomycetota bacterium]
MIRTGLLGVAQRAAVPPFHVMDVWAAAAERQRSHGDLVNLSAGQPSAPAPSAVRAAAASALDRDVLGYTVALGIPELRQAIAGHYSSRYRLRVDPADVVVTTGSSGGFLLAFLASFDAGDRVAVTNPGYPCHRNILTALGCEVVELPCGPETRFQPTLEMIKGLHVRGLVVASPANPTGTVLPAAELAMLAAYCEERGIQLVSDEVYHGITYGTGSAGRAETDEDGSGDPDVRCAWESSREAIVVNSFSKYFAMTGWRLGWMLVPPRLAGAVDRLTGNFTICPPTLAQHAAVAAFVPGSYTEADGHVARYRINRDLLLAGLPQIGLPRLAPADGAFYMYADVSDFTDDSMAFCRQLLAQTGVAITPGIDFDPVRGSRFVRLSFAGATVQVEEAVRRIGAWLLAR